MQKQKFEAFKSRIRKKSTRDILKEIPLAEFEAYFVEELRLDPEIVKIFRKKHQGLTAHSAINKELPREGQNDKLAQEIGLTSEEVRKKIAPFGFKFKTFSRFCRENGYQEKRGRDVFFNEAFVDGLVDEWVRKEQVMDIFNLSRSRFYQLLDEKKWPMIKIGKYTLVKLKKFLQGTRNRSFSAAEELGPIRPTNRGRFVQSEAFLRG